MSRDAVYTGAATLAGLAVFGSALMLRNMSHASFEVRIGAGTMAMAAMALANTQLIFAAMMCCNEPGPLVFWFTIPTIIFACLCILGYTYVITGRLD